MGMNYSIIDNAFRKCPCTCHATRSDILILIATSEISRQVKDDMVKVLSGILGVVC